MAAVAVEQAGVRRWTTTAGFIEARRSWHVYDNVTPSTTVDEYDALNAVAAPAGPNTFYGQPFAVGEESLIAMEFEVENIEGDNYRWSVTWIYREIHGQEQPPEPLVIGDERYVIRGGRSRFVPFLGWRSLANDPLIDPVTGLMTEPPPGPDAGDIEGEGIDAYGVPASVLVPVATFQIRQLCSMESVYGLADNQDIRTASADAAGKRNSTLFLENPNVSPPVVGFPVGYVMYEGMTAQRLSIGFQDVTHTFHYNRFAHCIQNAWRDVSQYAQTGHASAPAEYARLHAWPVYWIQPFPETIDFRAALNLAVGP